MQEALHSPVRSPVVRANPQPRKGWYGLGDCYDNAAMESFWGSMQIELLNRQRWTTVVELSTAIGDYIETFYKPERRHSSIDYLTPIEYEALHLSETQVGFS